MNLSRALLCAGALFVTSSAPAAVTLEGWWRFDNDSGAAAGSHPLNTDAADSSGNNHPLSSNGNGNLMTWSSDRPSASSLQFGGGTNSLSIQVPGSGGFYTGYSRNAWTTATDNVAFDVWIKPTTSSGVGFIMINSDGSSGLALVQNDSNLEVRLGLTTAVISAPLTINSWQQVALVRDNGTTTLYINGASVGTSASSPNAITGGTFALGEEFFGDGQNFTGFIDEARVSTWTTAGEFTASNLNYVSAIPEPSTYAAIAGAAVLGLAGWRRRMRSPVIARGAAT